jgi:hypothetical protein
MSARDTLTDLADFFERDPRLQLATVAKPPAPDAPPEARVLALSDDAKAFFASTIDARVRVKLSEWSLRQLDPTYKPDAGTVEWAQTADVEAVDFATSRAENLSPLAPFRSGDDEYKKRLSYWVAILTVGEQKAYFFRAFSAAAELKKKRGMALVSHNGTFGTVEEEIFLFDDSIDCFVFGDYLYVLRKNDYRRIFDQYEAIRRAARRASVVFQKRIPVANAEAFTDACANEAGLADKLIAVIKRAYFDTLTIDKLKPVITDFTLGIPIVTGDGGAEQLQFRTAPEHRWRILKLVDDDYLRSTMTGAAYEVNSKTDPPS